MKRTAMPPRKVPLRRTPFVAHRVLPSTVGGRQDPGITLEELDAAWLTDPLWPAARMVALRRDRYLCCHCGSPADDVHHRFLRQMGGRLDDPHRHDPERLVTLCRDYHSWVHQHPLAAKGPGYIVDQADDVLDTPVAMWTGLMTLTHDGRMSPLTVRYR